MATADSDRLRREKAAAGSNRLPGIGGKTEKDAGRDPKTGRFLKGNQSSGGRKPMPDEIRKAFMEASFDACRVLCSIVNDPESRAADKIRAAEAILDRGYGKPVQSVDVDTNAVPQVIFIGGDSIAD